MKKLFLITTLFVSLCSFSQTIGTVKTEEYKADFEKKQSIDVVGDYTGDIVLPIQVLKIGINVSSSGNISLLNTSKTGYLCVLTLVSLLKKLRIISLGVKSNPSLS